jgi:hypothetical protein
MRGHGELTVLPLTKAASYEYVERVSDLVVFFGRIETA